MKAKADWFEICICACGVGVKDGIASRQVSISHPRLSHPQFHACLNLKNLIQWLHTNSFPSKRLYTHTYTRFPRSAISPSLNSRKLLCFSVVYLLIPISPSGNKRLEFTGVWDLLMGREMGCSLVPLMPCWRTSRMMEDRDLQANQVAILSPTHKSETPHSHPLRLLGSK